MSKIHHVKASIAGLLKLSDKELSDLFDRSGSAIRKELNERMQAGEIYVGAEGCEGFDSVTGCPGHQSDGR